MARWLTVALGRAHSAASPLIGSLPVGLATYTVPGGSIYADPAGNDTTGNGTIGNPYATLTKAVSMATTGGTIVLRAGQYHEGSLPGSQGLGIQIAVGNLTIQNFPSEAVWLDGSSVLPSWALYSAGVWRHSWTYTFDRSGTYSWGGSSSGILVDPSYPLASHPEQFWVDDVALTQVATLGEVTSGTFYVDLVGHYVYIGTDPTGSVVTGSDRCAALTVLSSGAGATFRGFGIRKYGNQCPDFGVIKFNRANCTAENIWIEDCSTTGLYAYNGAVASHNLTLRNVTVLRCGQMGFGQTQADDLLIDSCLFDGNNASRFSGGQSAGNVKITKTKRVTIRNSRFNNALQSPGLWFDQSVFDVKVSTCDAQYNGTTGFMFENCTKAVFVDCLARGGAKGFHILGSNNVEVWNSTMTETVEPMVLQQDERTPANTPSNLDSRYPSDPDVDWFITSFVVKNCIWAKASTGAPHWRIKSINIVPPREWSTYGVVSNSNLLNRHSGSNSVCSGTTAAGEQYWGWSSYRTATGLDSASVFVDGVYALDATTSLPTSATDALLVGVGEAIPAYVATLAGRSTGTQHVGIWARA